MWAAVAAALVAGWPWIVRLGILAGIADAAWALQPLVVSIRKLGEQTNSGVDAVPGSLPFTVKADGQGGTYLAPKTENTPLIIAAVGAAILLLIISRR